MMYQRATRSATLLFLTGVAMSTGCTSSHPEAGLPSFADTPQVTTVAVEARDIVSVVSLDGTIVANSSVMLVAPVGGTVRYTPSAEAPTTATVTSSTGTVTTIKVPRDVLGLEALVVDGAKVPEGLPALSGRFTGFAVRAEVTADKVYRLGVLGSTRAQVTSGPGPFDCPLLGAPQSPDASTGSVGAVLTCAIPSDVSAVLGAPAIMAITTGAVSNVLALPVEAVAGLAQRGTVGVIDGGHTEQREVGLGITDGRYVEITSGLKAGDQVSVPPPDLEQP